MKANELFEKVTDDLVAAIEAGASGWQMPWQRLAANRPVSVDDRPYRGWNALVLAMTAAERGWPSGRWATYRGWQRRGCQVRRGERGTHVVLWKPTSHTTAGDNVTQDVDRGRPAFFARVFTVFAAEQADGTERFTPDTEPVDEAHRIAKVELYFAEVGARIVAAGDRACYVPALDQIHLPALTQFADPSALYSTAAHEHAHWTGHESRLARDLSGRFGDHAYGAEELIAEFAAAFWCAQFGLEQATREDHAAYLGDWLAMLKADARALVAACSHAQRAVDFLNQAAKWSAPALSDADTLAESA